MLTCTLADVAAWTQGRLRGPALPVTGVSTDSRQLASGDLFIALRGDHHDGHDHVAAAAAGGAVAALVERPLPLDLPQVCVDDTLRALGDLAHAQRARVDARVVGITGSNGKTTVKNLTAAILALHGPTHVTAGNYNNEIGLPLTLLAMPPASAYAVLEMGAGKPGDIAYLAAIAQPQVSLVNTVAPAHLERMGTLRGIAETKGAIYTALPADGVAVINAECDFAAYFEGLAGARRQLHFGWATDNDVYAEAGTLGATGSRFSLHLPDAVVDVDLPLAGRHNVANAMAAATIAHALGVPAATIAAGLAQAAPVAGRLALRALPGGWSVIDDSYNANPGSVRAAIDTLLLHPGEHWLVLGDMAELGPDARELHANLGWLAHQRGVERLFTCGPLAACAAEAFGPGAQAFADRAELLAAIRAQHHAGVVCLVKGSHAAAMDKVVAALAAQGDGHVA